MLVFRTENSSRPETASFERDRGFESGPLQQRVRLVGGSILARYHEVLAVDHFIIHQAKNSSAARGSARILGSATVAAGFEPSVPPPAGLEGRGASRNAKPTIERKGPPGSPRSAVVTPHISTSAPSSMTRSGGMRKKSVERVAMRARPE